MVREYAKTFWRTPSLFFTFNEARAPRSGNTRRLRPRRSSPRCFNEARAPRPGNTTAMYAASTDFVLLQ
jgi:hypothetical protein